jgi:hypothetical protein
VNNDNKSNSSQIGQVVAMGGSEKTQDFFLRFLHCEYNSKVHVET